MFVHKARPQEVNRPITAGLKGKQVHLCPLAFYLLTREMSGLKLMLLNMLFRIQSDYSNLIHLVKIIFLLVSSIVVSSLQVISNCVLPALVLNRQQEVFSKKYS